VAFPQYRIPIERLKEEWARRIAWKHMRRRRSPVPPSKITDNSEPWIRNPSSVADGDPFSRALLEEREIP
jgi:hypothetical protein